MADGQRKPTIVVAEIDDNAGGKPVERRGGDAGYGTSIVLDMKSALDIHKELGLGKYYEKTYNGRRYIIFKGRPGLRQTLNGTRYRAMNPKVVDLGLGKRGVAKSAVRGTGAVILVFAAVNVLNYLLNDKFTLSHLIGNMATDVIKAVVSAGAGYMVASAIAGGATVIAVGPVLVGLAVGIGVGLFLDWADEKWGITDKLVAALQSTGERIQKKADEVKRDVNRNYARFERELIWFLSGGNMTIDSYFR